MQIALSYILVGVFSKIENINYKHDKTVLMVCKKVVCGKLHSLNEQGV